MGQDAHLLGNVLSMRAAIMSASGEPEAADRMFQEAKALAGAAPVRSHEPPNMLDAIHYYQSFQLEKVRSACPAVAAMCRERGDAWNASSVEFYGLWGEMYCGRPEAGAEALPHATLRAQKIGHHGAMWALKIGASIVSAARGDLAASNRETIDAWEFGSAHHLGWNFATSIQRGHFALWAGDLAEAERWYSDELKTGGKSYLSGLSEACLFAAYAETGDPRAADTWTARHWKTPISGQLNSLGAWTALERTVIGLARLGGSIRRLLSAPSPNNCSSPAHGPTPCSRPSRPSPGSRPGAPATGPPPSIITSPPFARPTSPLIATCSQSPASGTRKCFTIGAIRRCRQRPLSHRRGSFHV